MSEASTMEGSMILCCSCGVPIRTNPSNMCATCVRSRIDITEGIPKQVVLHFCRNCERYLQPPGEWIAAALESRELLALCLKKLPGLKALKLVDAGFVWTEAHSKRIKLKLTVHGEIPGGTTLEQVFIVDFLVQNHMCDDCHRIEAKDFWRCVVQVRQRAENKKTFFYLEQLILKHKAHVQTLGIKAIHGGLDFYYGNANQAQKLIDFLQSIVPVKITASKRLISHDIHSNSFNYKYTWSAEIAPISKDSAICLSKKQSQQLGNVAPICLVLKVASGIHLIDPLSGQIAHINGTAYFRSPFEAVCNPHQLTEYVVMNIEEVAAKERRCVPGQGQVSVKHVICDVWVIRASELGLNNNNIHTRSHLGHLLKIGDSVMGYNLSESNINNSEFEKLGAEQVPDVILVRKCYADRQTRINQRKWVLKHLTEELTNERSKSDFHDFLEDIEEDADYRKEINIYRDSKRVQVDSNDTESTDNIPHITLAEMLEDLTLEAADDAMGDNLDQ